PARTRSWPRFAGAWPPPLAEPPWRFPLLVGDGGEVGDAALLVIHAVVSRRRRALRWRRQRRDHEVGERLVVLEALAGVDEAGDPPGEVGTKPPGEEVGGGRAGAWPRVRLVGVGRASGGGRPVRRMAVVALSGRGVGAVGAFSSDPAV